MTKPRPQAPQVPPATIPQLLDEAGAQLAKAKKKPRKPKTN